MKFFFKLPIIMHSIQWKKIKDFKKIINFVHCALWFVNTGQSGKTSERIPIPHACQNVLFMLVHLVRGWFEYRRAMVKPPWASKVIIFTTPKNMVFFQQFFSPKISIKPTKIFILITSLVSLVFLEIFFISQQPLEVLQNCKS